MHASSVDGERYDVMEHSHADSVFGINILDTGGAKLTAAKACSYSKPAQRVVPSRKLVDKLTSNVELYKGILTKLVGNTQLDSLANLSREELLQLALASPEVTQGTSPSVANARAMSEIHTGSDGADSLEALEQAPPEDPYWDEARKHQVRVQGISDDVNGLSMSVDRLSSYVGISSITAALKVIVRCAPQARPLLTHNNQAETALPSRANSPPPELINNHPLALPAQQEGERLIESYFDRCHPFFPLIDERKFWATYLHGNRMDSQWLALLNIVFAVGSLASSTADNQAHYTYFNRSRRHMSLDSFGSGNIEVLQALGIMCGYYMHYLNRPNEAHSLMGGTLRMATSLGLHREYSERSETGRQLAQSEEEEEAISPEMRRRMWWSLFCLDAWASTTTGRPSLGRMGPSITVMKPGTAANAVPTIIMPNSPQFMDQLKLLPLTHASTFCAIATKIQDRLVESPLLPHAEISAYDAQIMNWHEELPSILSSYDEQCPEFLHRKITPPQPSIPPTPHMQQQQAYDMSSNFYSTFETNQQPFDFNATGLPNWPDANLNDPNYLNYFWDDMMWDTNLPDMQDAPFGMSNVYDFTGAAQDSGMDGAYWMHGN
ncbi:hypothetical protein E8E12_002552 [Didymella heteroderae]|uniref:Xylanolytic transcriptional activator regulatory domain-containing protein n=1 Tax=Didymella heteroderae TaxID=1769908 RepID=A0A9P5C1Z7_9PLEO|nr:hypothetical protein E8E12_002552 [Didymella heteroderae]